MTPTNHPAPESERDEQFEIVLNSYAEENQRLSDEADRAKAELDAASRACLELAAAHGLATGHGDTVADMIRELFDGLLSRMGGEPVAWRTCFSDGGRSAWFDGKPPNYHGPYEMAYASPPAPALDARTVDGAVHGLAEWKLVPVNPSPAMVIAAAHVPAAQQIEDATPRNVLIYKAMIGAAPAPIRADQGK